jgi:hypothetical protein
MKTTDSVRKGCCSILLRMLNRIQATETDISDAVLNMLIADEQAFVEAYPPKNVFGIRSAAKRARRLR